MMMKTLNANGWQWTHPQAAVDGAVMVVMLAVVMVDVDVVEVKVVNETKHIPMMLIPTKWKR